MRQLFIHRRPMKKRPEGLIFEMGRTMGIEPTHVWFTARCVNHFTTIARFAYAK